MEYKLVVEQLTQRVCERNGWDYDTTNDPDADATIARREAENFLSDANSLEILKNVEM